MTKIFVPQPLPEVVVVRKMFQRAEAASWGKDDAGRVIEVYEGKDKTQ